jgi:hypothetical protein
MPPALFLYQRRADAYRVTGVYIAIKRPASARPDVRSSALERIPSQRFGCATGMQRTQRCSTAGNRSAAPRPHIVEKGGRPKFAVSEERSSARGGVARRGVSGAASARKPRIARRSLPCRASSDWAAETSHNPARGCRQPGTEKGPEAPRTSGLAVHWPSRWRLCSTRALRERKTRRGRAQEPARELLRYRSSSSRQFPC